MFLGARSGTSSRSEVKPSEPHTRNSESRHLNGPKQFTASAEFPNEFIAAALPEIRLEIDGLDG